MRGSSYDRDCGERKGGDDFEGLEGNCSLLTPVLPKEELPKIWEGGGAIGVVLASCGVLEAKRFARGRSGSLPGVELMLDE